MKKFLVVVDMQKDFVDGALGSKEAQEMVPFAARKIKEFDGEVFVTLDTHTSEYMNTSEGRKLPVPHCIKGTDDWELNGDIKDALSGKQYTAVEKVTFGSADLAGLIGKAAGEEEFSIELIGLCTDICVVSNALLLKAAYPEADISVDAKCCAGVTKALHNAALDTMGSCQINILNRE